MRKFPLALLLVLCSFSAFGATFTVNSTVDAQDVNPGDGVCADSAAACTLRAAVMEANALGGADTIVVPAGTYLLNIPGANEDLCATGDLDVTGNVTITGAGAATTIVDGNDLDRVLDVFTGPVVITGLTLRNGQITGVNGEAGVLRNAATLTLTSCAVNDGLVDIVGPGGEGTSAYARGGGIANSGTLTMDLCEVRNNVAQVVGTRSNMAHGGGIFNTGTLEVRRTTIAGNLAAATEGPGIGDARAHGGGIATTAGTLTLVESTLSTNTSSSSMGSHRGGGLGGGLYLASAGSVTNCTISANEAPGFLPTNPGSGGGLYKGSSDPVTFTNVTITKNRAGSSAGFSAGSGGSLTLLNSIVAANEGNSACSGTATSAGYNILAFSGCTTSNATDIITNDPQLGPLQNNGGPTQTHMPLSGSPAIDNASPTTFPPTDQRGAPRPAEGNFDGVVRADIGAVESCSAPAISGPHSAAAGSTVTFTATAGATSYQWYRNGQPIGGATSSTLTLTNVSALTHSGFYTVETNFGCSGLSPEHSFSVPYPIVSDHLLWDHDGNGQTYLWQLNNTSVVFARPQPTVGDPAWGVVGSGDANGDGHRDYFWQHDVTGQVSIWFSNSTDITVLTVLPMPPAASWKVQLVADFDGDAKVDVFFQNTGVTPRQNMIWLLDGITVRRTITLPNTDPGWQLAAGDFDATGTADIAWYQSGAVIVWLMRGGAVASSHAVPYPPVSPWALVGCGDFDADGRADLLWREASSGANYVWRMNGAQVLGAHPLPTVADLNWTISATGDYNHDGQADIIWRHLTSGSNYIWLITGATPTPTTVAPLPSVTDTLWKIVAPKPNARS